eukprot:COSAG02_NODE_13_length_57813_cov_14.298276_45_plen_625_part_00
MLCSTQSRLLDVLLVLLGAATTCGQLEQQQASPSAAAGAGHQCPPGHVIEQDAVCDGCRRCGPGKEPGSGSAECIPCQMGWAELGGICFECPPGRHQNSLQTGCDECPAGRYRGVEGGGNWDSAECAECPEGMISAAGSTRHMDCHCPVGTYDRREWGTYDGRKMNGSFVRPGRSSPITCFRSGLSIGRTLGERQAENLASFTDYYQLEHTKRNCVRCPTCVECGEEAASAYRGRPTVKAGWAVLRDEAHLSVEAKAAMRHAPPFDVREGHQSVLMVMSGRRDVFGCPYDEKILAAHAASQLILLVDENEASRSVCKAELRYANQSTYQSGEPTYNPNITLCERGFVGPVCSACTEGYTRSTSEGCTPCADATENATQNAITGFIAIGLIFFLVCLICICERSVFHKMKNYFRVVALVLPKLVGDIRVFISVYQVVGSMEDTLAMKWPGAFEGFMRQMRGYVSFDVFALPSVGCIVTHNFYTKLWMQLGIPAIMELLMYIYYTSKYSALNLGHIPDLERDKVAWSYLSRVHGMERKLKESKTNDWHSFGIFRQARRWDTAEEEKHVQEIKENAFADEHDNDYEHLLSLVSKVIEQAEASAAHFEKEAVMLLMRCVSWCACCGSI